MVTQSQAMNSWSCGRATAPRTQIFRTGRMQDLIFKISTRLNVWQSSESKNKIFLYWQTFFNFQWTFIVHKEQSVIEWKVYACYLEDFLTHAVILIWWADLEARPVPELCIITNEVMDNVFNNHSHRISQWNRDILSSLLLQEYADAIHAKGSPLENCFGFIDGTVRSIARPNQQQRIVYNGPKRVHSLKFQSLALPNGLIGNMYGPVGKLLMYTVCHIKIYLDTYSH